MLKWVKDFIVPFLGYVLRDASGQQCHRRAIVSRSNWIYVGHVDYSILRGFITARISKKKVVHYLTCNIFIYTKTFCGIRLVRVLLVTN